MISAFQSDQVWLLKRLYDRVYVPEAALAEYECHQIADGVAELIRSGFVIVRELTTHEKARARRVSEEIAAHPIAKNSVPECHYPEAEAIVLTLRGSLGAVEVLLDELAAREVAKRHGAAVVGFPGVLVRACRRGLLTPPRVRDILVACQRAGTHYSDHLIQIVDASLGRETHGQDHTT